MSAEKAGHAPEPWIILHCKMCTVIQDREQRNICELWTPTRAEAEPNARLIACAPDLLAMVERYASECSECGGTGAVQVCCGSPDQSGSDDEVCCGVPDTEPCGACADLRAVIEKAEGGV